ncbi:MAG: hypothetical protein JXA79_03240 [Deltaproteobacteria bacterium]|nr:hypothetical protein [Deltaproteobacteria bacterium]
MKRFWVFGILTIGIICFFITFAQAGDYTGLWAGSATLKYVSEVNTREPDLSFDLAMEAVKDQDILVAQGAEWRYLDSGTNPDDTWTESLQTGWDTGAAPLGFGDVSLNTFVDFGADKNDKYITTYFQHQFTVAEPDGYTDLLVKVWRDDGITVYLNGEKIVHNNLPSGYADYQTQATLAIIDSRYIEITIPSSHLQSDNLLSVEVHLASKTDPDLFFDLELSAFLKEEETTQVIPLSTGGWQYYYQTAAPVSEWKNNTSGSGWKTGWSRFGFGEVDENGANLHKTELFLGTTPKPPAAYFRKTFDFADAGYSHLKLLLLQDDGAVVYINGQEVARENMPTGAIEHDTGPLKALGSVDENFLIVREIDLSNVPLQATNNVLAVEVHQHPSELQDAQSSNTTALTRTSSTLDLRLLLHVDAGNNVRFLKEVIQMFDEKTNKYVLLTNHSLIPNYKGVTLRDDEPVGRRISSVGFDFEGYSLECSGSFDTGSVTCELNVDSNHPTNPFLHKYHPDHDNLDPRYEKVVEEAYKIVRSISLKFSNRYPPDEDLMEREYPPLGWGETKLGGVYTETVKGLHQDDIQISGPFTLERISVVKELKE